MNFVNLLWSMGSFLAILNHLSDNAVRNAPSHKYGTTISPHSDAVS